MALDSVNARKYGITYRWGVLNAAYNKVGAIGHPGVDLGAKYAPVYAEFPGTVTDTITGHAGYGNYIRISDIDGDRWLYAHLSAFAVSKGQTVKRGQVIGTSGNTGMSTGPHLHLEVFPKSGGDSRYYGTVDPIAYLAKETRNIEDVSITPKPTAPKEEIMQTDADVVLAYNNFRAGNGDAYGQPSAQEIAYWKGKPFKAILEAARGGEVKNRNNQLKSLTTFHQSWNDKVADLSTRPTKAELQASVDAQKALEAKLTESLARPPQTLVEYVEKEVVRETVKPFTDEDGANWLRKKIIQLLGFWKIK